MTFTVFLSTEDIKFVILQTTPRNHIQNDSKNVSEIHYKLRRCVRFGNVYLHRDMLKADERCIYGGGLWKIDHQRSGCAIRPLIRLRLPDFDFVKRVDWSGLGGEKRPLAPTFHTGPTKTLSHR